MGALDPHVQLVLDELSPLRPPPDRWEEILANAQPQSHARRRWVVGAVPLLAVLATVVVVLAWPFGGGPRGTILERAAAAIGDGPVLHVVIQSGWGGTQIDLATGARTQVHGEEELWYDAQRGIHQVSSFAGVVQSDSVYPSGRVPYLDKTLASLGTSYRKALHDGTARVLGSSVIEGEPVYWIRVDTQMLPDSADDKLHEWAHDVAISKESFKPVATRETRDGQPSPDGISTVESVETLPAGQGDFSPAQSATNSEAMRSSRKGSLTTPEATAVLGQPALWAGRSVAGVALARISRDERSEGFDRRRGTWARTYTGVTFFYGAAEGGGIGTPPPTVPYVQIAESRTLDDGFQRGVRHYSPPEGSILVFGGHIAVMQQSGLHLALESSSEELLLAAARALEPVPGG